MTQEPPIVGFDSSIFLGGYRVTHIFGNLPRNQHISTEYQKLTRRFIEIHGFFCIKFEEWESSGQIIIIH